jgi:hypothetical protein
LREYVARHADDEVTEALDRIYGDAKSEPEFVSAASRGFWSKRSGDFQGEVWWADLPAPTGSGPGFRRPVSIVQGDAFNRSRIDTVVCVPLTSNTRSRRSGG